MHDPFLVHVVESLAQLLEVLPDGLFGNESLLFLEVLDHARQVTGIGQFQHNEQLVVGHKRLYVPNDVGVVQLLQQIDLLDAIVSRLSIRHLVDLTEIF